MKLFDQMVPQINLIVYVSGSQVKFYYPYERITELPLRSDRIVGFLIYLKKSVNCEKWEISANPTMKIF